MQFRTSAVALQIVLALLLAGKFAHGAEPTALSDSSAQGAPVASFDCAHAASSREQLVCGDSELAALDEQLGHIYRERKARLSLSGGQLLKGSEQSWLRFIDTVCPVNTSGTDPKGERRDCLKRRYTQRLKQIQMVGQRFGPFLFNRVDLYSAEPTSDEGGAIQGFSVHHVAYPQIDDASSKEMARWNNQTAQELSEETECEDDDVDYEIGYANARFISMQWQHSAYCHGTPHGYFDIKTQNFVLSPHLESLPEQDVFGPGNAWAKALQSRFWAALLQTGWRVPDGQPAEVKQELEDDFIRPDAWLFVKDGLRVSFGSYEGGCYACTPAPVTLPWAALKPLLSKNAVVP